MCGVVNSGVVRVGEVISVNDATGVQETINAMVCILLCPLHDPNSARWAVCSLRCASARGWRAGAGQAPSAETASVLWACLFNSAGGGISPWLGPRLPRLRGQFWLIFSASSPLRLDKFFCGLVARTMINTHEVARFWPAFDHEPS